MRRARAVPATGERAAGRPRMGAARAAVLAGCGALLGVLMLLGATTSVRAAGLPSGPRPPGGDFANPVVRAVDIDTPAVVRVGTTEEATLTLQLCTRSLTLPLGGGTYKVGGTGSGAFISGNGDILTADHVVHPPDDEVLYFAAYDVAQVLDNLSQYDAACGLSGGAVSPDDVANGLVNLKYTTHVTDLHTVVWLSTAYSGPIDASSLKDAPTLDATVEAFSSFTQDDVAIVHVNLTDTPSIAVGHSEDVAVEDALTVIGFPGNGDVTESADNMLTPSVNEVAVSAIKRNDNGSPLIQVAGNVEHGDSGGPLLDAAGEVVGVVSFAGPDPQGSTSYMRATSSAQPLITSQSINTAPGHFQLAWTQAFDDYAATYPGHWHAAKAKLEALAASYPQFKAVSVYLAYARSAAAAEPLPNASGQLSPTMLLIAGVAAAVVVLLAALALILVLRGRARRKARAAAQLPQPGYPQAYPYGYPMGVPGAPQPYGQPSWPTMPPMPPMPQPYGPGYGQPQQMPPTGPAPEPGKDGPMPVSVRAGAAGAITPLRADSASAAPYAPPPSPGPSGLSGSSRSSWGAPLPPGGADAYNSGGGDGFGGSSGH